MERKRGHIKTALNVIIKKHHSPEQNRVQVELVGHTRK